MRGTIELGSLRLPITSAHLINGKVRLVGRATTSVPHDIEGRPVVRGEDGSFVYLSGSVVKLSKTSFLGDVLVTLDITIGEGQQIEPVKESASGGYAGRHRVP